MAHPTHRPAVLVLLVQALVLGVLQGATEFLPVSSSGHLHGVPYLVGWDPSDVTFTVMLHAGTLLAVLAYFRSDVWFLATRALGLAGDDPDERRLARRTVALLAVGTAPAALAGWQLEPMFEAAFEDIRAIAGFLYVTALLLTGAEWLRRRRVAVRLGKRVGDLEGRERHVDPGRDEGTTSMRDAAGIGLAQAAAILPGISRSGATIAAGMALGLSRAGAARFSFLLSIPVILGATVSELPELGTTTPGTAPFGATEITVGVVAATISGYLAIRFLLRLVQTEDLLGFARYVAGFATLLLAAFYLVIG